MPTKFSFTSAQAEYMQFLLTKAEERAKLELNFDPQGRVIVDVVVDPSEYKEINAAYVSKNEMEKALNRKITPITTVSLDIKEDPQLQNLYEQKVRAALSKITDDNKQIEGILTALKKLPKENMIALQQELHFHLLLAARTYQKIDSQSFTDDKLNEAHQSSMRKINQLIMKAFAGALLKAYKDKQLDVKTINTVLDKARGDIAVKAHGILRHEIEKTGVTFSENQLKKIKHLTEETASNANDLLHTSSSQNLGILIAGSAHTSHHRVQGTDFAHRQIITCQYTKGTFQNNASERIQIRTPSLDLKDSTLSEATDINDIQKKLEYVSAQYKLKENLPNQSSGIPKGYVYNLHTALNGWFDGSNYQTQGAKRILQASHRANAQALKADKNECVFCFVQNISVNGFGDNLGPTSRAGRFFRRIFGYDNNVTDEATLMTEVSLLHTLSNISDPLITDKITKVMGQYKEFLQSEQDEFASSDQGKKAREIIDDIKQRWKNNPEISSTDDVVLNAKQSLKYLMANNLHYEHEYAKLVQTLSIFIENASISGCKSGNERAQAINARVGVLDSAANDPSNPIYSELIASLKTLAQGKNTKTNAKQLKTSLDTLYNKTGLQGALSIVSLADQGAAAKVEPKAGGFFKNLKSFFQNWWNTNRAEESDTIMSNLKQSGAGKLQAHKGLPKMMAETWAKSQAKNEKNIAEFIEPETLSPVLETQKQKLLSSIGDYKLPSFNPRNILSPDGMKALYKNVSAYKEKNKDKDPQQHRKAFIEYMLSPRMQERIGLIEKERLALIEQGNTENGAVKIEDALDKKGLKLYQDALKEERCSKEYMDAVLQASTEHFAGEKWAQRMVVPIGGPSASGKSFGANGVVKTAAQFMPTIKGDTSGNDVVAIDGGIAREVSQIRKLMIQFALKLGYTGVADLHEKSDTLSNVKKDVQEAVFKTPNLSAVIPETFSNPLAFVADKLVNQVNELKDAKLIYARVDSNDESFKSTIKFNGDKRAWKSDTKPLPDYDLNLNKKFLPESKNYDAGFLDKNFLAGRKFSKSAEETFKKEFKDCLDLTIVYDLILVKPGKGNDWVRTENPGPGVKSFSKRIFDQWKQLADTPDRPSLEKYNEDHLKDLNGAIIKTPQLLTLESTTFKLESRMHKLGEQRIDAVFEKVRNLYTLWKKNQWEEYQNSVDNIQVNIKILLELHKNRPFPEPAVEKLKKMLWKLEKAREDVPEKAKISKPIQTNEKEVYVSATSNLDFVREIVTEKELCSSYPESEDKDITSLQTTSSMSVSCQGVNLKKGQCVRSYQQFSSDHYALLKQSEDGKVEDYSSKNLTNNEKILVAVEQAQMLLINWSKNSGEIRIKGRNAEDAHRVYAALLLLKDSHSNLKNIVINSIVSGCDGPDRLEFQSSYINRHLGSESTGPLNKTLRTVIKQETADLINKKGSDIYKLKLRETIVSPNIQKPELDSSNSVNP